MQFLHVNESAEWCREHGADICDPWELQPDPRLTNSARILFAPNGSIGLEPQVLAACIGALGPADEYLLWITEWEIWPSTEDWPAFYHARGARGETTSLSYKPGHLFTQAESEALRLFLSFPIQNGWDADLLVAVGPSIVRRLHISHDGWVELHTDHEVRFSLAAA